MPRKKTSARKRERTPDAYIGDIDNAQGWHTVINILCDVYGLPGWICTAVFLAA